MSLSRRVDSIVYARINDRKTRVAVDCDTSRINNGARRPLEYTFAVYRVV